MANTTGNKTNSSDFLRVLLTLKDNIMQDLNVADICKVTQISGNDIVCVPISDSTVKYYCNKLQEVDIAVNDIVLVIFTNKDYRLNLKRLRSSQPIQNSTTGTLHSSEYGVVIATLFRSTPLENGTKVYVNQVFQSTWSPDTINTNISILQNDVSSITNSYMPIFPYGIYDCNTCCDAGLYQVANGVNCPSGIVYGSLLVLTYRQKIGNTKPDFATQIFMPNGDNYTKPNSFFYRTSLADSWNNWQELDATSILSSIQTLKDNKMEVDSSGTVTLTGGNSTVSGYYIEKQIRINNALAHEIEICIPKFNISDVINQNTDTNITITGLPTFNNVIFTPICLITQTSPGPTNDYMNSQSAEYLSVNGASGTMTIRMRRGYSEKYSYCNIYIKAIVN